MIRITVDNRLAPVLSRSVDVAACGVHPLRYQLLGALCNLVGIANVRSGSKPTRSSLEEQPYLGRAEFFALPVRGRAGVPDDLISCLLHGAAQNPA
jgi:hypothetical protein